MPAISEISTDQLNTIRSGGYSGEVRICVDPSPVVFQCEVDETLVNAVFLSFAWTNTLQGDYEDVVPDMTVLITATDDPAELRRPLWRGRAPRVPTASVFYINESSFNLQTGYVVTVLNTYEALQMDRSGAFVDGYIPYANLPPAIKNMQSFYYGESIGALSFSFAPTAQAMAQGATIDAYHWTIPGAVYDTGDEDTQNITVTVPYGHVWAFLDVTDSNDVTQRFKFEILVCDRDDPDYMYEAHGDVSINGDTETGWTASVSYFAGVETLLNRTRVAIVVFDHYKSGAGVFPNVMFIGYLVQEDTGVTADAVSSTLAETSFEIQGFSAIIAQLPVPSLAIRNVASPAAWEQIQLPTIQRVIWHLIARYSTFGTLCAIDFVTTDSTWFGGEMDLESSTLLESINLMGEEINARLVFFPQGDATLEINANFLSDSDRNALPDLIASGSITPSDLFSYNLPLPYFDTVGQIEAGFATFYTDGSTPVKLSGIAPAVARQEGIETPVVLAQLLPANLTAPLAIEAAKQRIGDLLEWQNPPTLIPFTAHDGWHFLTPSLRVWLSFDLPADDSTRALAIPPSWRYLLLNIALVWHSDGTFDVTGTARLETQGGLSQVNVSISPNVVNTDLPVLPAASDYDAFTPDGTLNYLTTDVPDADLQPFRRGGYAVMQFMPMTTRDAAQAAENYPEPSCCVISPPVNFKSSETRLTPNATVNNEIYTVTLRGDAQLSSDEWLQFIDFRLTDGSEYGFLPNTTFHGGTWVAGVGWTASDGVLSGGFYRRGWDLEATGLDPTEFTGFSASSYDYTGGAFASSPTGAFGASIGATTLWDILDTDMTDGTDLNEGWAGSVTDTELRITMNTSEQAAPVFSGSSVLVSLTITGKGTNPFPGGTTAGIVRGDAFYFGYNEEAGGLAQLYGAQQGFRINSQAVPVPPPYNPNHIYEFTYEGDGNQTPFGFADTDYDDNQAAPLYITVCGANMGT